LGALHIGDRLRISGLDGSVTRTSEAPKEEEQPKRRNPWPARG
jgi:hypothetical protein